MSLLKFPYFVALDLDDKDRICQLIKDLSPYVGGFKLGPRVVMRFGKDIFDEISVPIFYDPKYFDIPATVMSSIQTAFDCGAQFVTVHAANGPECLERIAELEATLNKQRPFKVLVVTVLTSFDQNNYPSHWKSESPASLVQSLLGDMKKSGIKNLVCSAQEVEEVKKNSPDFYCVTPGIRFAGGNKSDQKRVVTPGEALQSGADALVIGRPIIHSPNPVEQALKVISEIPSER